MSQETNPYNEIYWELLRRTPEYSQFYKKYAETNSLTEDHKKFIEDQGEFSSAPGFYGALWPWMITSLMATKEFGVRFWKKGRSCRNDRSLFHHGVLGTPVASVVSPDIPYNLTPCEISFFPPAVALVECPDLGVPGKSESLIEKIERTSTWKAEALFRIRLNESPQKIVGEFEREIRKIRNALKEAGKLKISPLFGTFFPRSFLRRIKRNTFYQYLRWYDLYMGLKNIPGISFSAIASLEKLKKFERVDTQKVIDTITGKSDFHFPELDKVNASLVSKVTKGIKVIDQIISKTPLRLSPGRKKDTIKPPPILRDRVGMWETEARTTGGGKRTPKRQSLDEQESSRKTLPLKYRQIKK